MTEIEFEPDWFSKPGDSIRRAMAAKELSIEDLSSIAKTPASEFAELYLGTKAIDEASAEMLGSVFGTGSTFWINRQRHYDQMVEKCAAKIDDRTMELWLGAFPKRELEESGWITRTTSKHDALLQLIKFFDVAGPSNWEAKYAEYLRSVNFRTSDTFQNKIGALTAWLRRAEMEAELLATAEWSPDALRNNLSEIRKLTIRKSPSSFLSSLREFCAASGVALVFLKAPKGCRASGATRMMSDGRAMMVLSFRYLSNDHFWFTLFHELAHLLLHQGSMTLFEGNETRGTQEDEANDFASRLLIPARHFDELETLGSNRSRIVRFAKKLGIAPGIVVGQLQHFGYIGPHQMNYLKRRYTWEELGSSLASL